MSIGYTVAAPTIMNVLVSCSNESSTWPAQFFSEEEKYMVTHLVDIILPSDEKAPGAIDINIPQFIDKMYHDIELDTNKDYFKKGAQLFANTFLKSKGKNILKANKDDFNALVTEYFDVSDEASKNIFNLQRKAPEKISPKDIESYTIYKFLLSVRYYTIFGYCTSEKIGEEVLAYDPIPGGYNACISVEEATGGRAWSLS